MDGRPFSKTAASSLRERYQNERSDEGGLVVAGRTRRKYAKPLPDYSKAEDEDRSKPCKPGSGATPVPPEKPVETTMKVEVQSGGSSADALTKKIGGLPRIGVTGLSVWKARKNRLRQKKRKLCSWPKARNPVSYLDEEWPDFDYSLDFGSLDLTPAPGKVLFPYDFTPNPIPESSSFFTDHSFYEIPTDAVRETNQESIIKMMKNTRIYFNLKLDIPRTPKATKDTPSPVQLFELTNSGSVWLTMKDDYNLVTFGGLSSRMESWLGVQRMREIDSRIDKEAVEVGLIVLVKLESKYKIDQQWIRAQITGFTDTAVDVVGVDRWITLTLPYEKIFYYNEILNDVPFQIQEFYLAGLEKWENSFLIGMFWSRIEEMFFNDDEWPLRFSDEEDSSDSYDDDETDRNGYDWIDYPELTFWLTDVQKKKGRYYVQLKFPDEIANGASVNDWLKEQIKNFNPATDLPRCPY